MSVSPPRVRPRYGRRHQEARERVRPFVLSGQAVCPRCEQPILPHEKWDLGHDDDDPRRYSGPEHVRCNRATAGRHPVTPEVEQEPEVEGIAQGDSCWDVPWMKGYRRPPRGATWPRYMTRPHPRAVGSLGKEFIRFAEKRSGRKLRWWQRLVATRLLEHDAEGKLVWETLILSLSRQLGKSWLLRELAMWRVHQGKRFGEPQDVLHTGKNVAICKEVQRPVRVWAKSRPDEWHVREVNGQETVELLADGSRWALRAKEAVYGYGASVGAVDEAWKVRSSAVDEGLVPVLVEREQAQLWLISTAHRMATSLMLGRRKAALQHLRTGEGDLLIEWSAPFEAELDDRSAWKQASPHWSARRERMIAKALDAIAEGGETDLDEPDPREAFRSQWLNIWPKRKTEPPGVVTELLEPGVWDALAESGLSSRTPVFVGVEDDFGRGAGIAVVTRLADGRLEADGWRCSDWDEAVSDLMLLADRRRIAELHVGASLLDRFPASNGLPRPRPALAARARSGLSTLRDLAASGYVVHDTTTPELDAAVNQARVKEAVSGLFLLPGEATCLVKALAWALAAAQKPSRIPAIH